MKIPVSWLKELVNVEFKVDELVDKLIFSGIEVEGIETLGSYEGVVAGEIVAVEKHPNADRLRLCKVNNGKDVLPVVCGADNFEVGDKAAFAGVGVVLGDGFKIKNAKIRGEVSEGMLCAEDELGISDDHEGIMLLPRDVAAGTPLVDIIGEPEVVIDLEITWNRADCLSMIGVAREVAALFDAEFIIPEIELKEDNSKCAGDFVKVSIENGEDCPRYTARVLSGVKLGESPEWMRKRLQMCGVRPINNVVDITNYVMLECGQPLHAFDMNKVSGGEIIVRRAGDGEKLKTLDDVERDLQSDMLVIADKKVPIALAGVMGGAESEISDGTENVLLESAMFAPALVHTASERLGLSSESSHRFERGIDYERVEWASRRAAQLMVEYANAILFSGIVDCKKTEPEKRLVKCRYHKVRDLLGFDVGDDEIVDIFRRLRLPVVAKDEESCTVESPSFRQDIDIEADLIEEVARMYGLDKVPDVELIARVMPDMDDSYSRAVRELRQLVISLGFTECMHYSFVSHKLLDMFDPGNMDERVVLPNPVSREYEVLRNSLVPQMAETLFRNMAHQTLAASAFEIGKVFLKELDGSIREEDHLSLGMMGNVGRFGPDGNKPVMSDEIFLWMKGAIERIVELQKIKNFEFIEAKSPTFEDGWALELRIDGKSTGTFGILSKKIKYKSLVGPVVVAELAIEPFCRGKKGKKELKPLPVYPGIRRDMALIAGKNVTHRQIIENIWKNAPDTLTSVTLFDIFSLVGKEAEKVSLAYSLIYRSLDRSLTDEEANKFHESIKAALKKELNVQFR